MGAALTIRFETRTTECSGSTRVPSSVTTTPLMETLPAAMSSSALRRDATPHSLRNRWRRGKAGGVRFVGGMEVTGTELERGLREAAR